MMYEVLPLQIHHITMGDSRGEVSPREHSVGTRGTATSELLARRLFYRGARRA